MGGDTKTTDGVEFEHADVEPWAWHTRKPAPSPALCLEVIGVVGGILAGVGLGVAAELADGVVGGALL